MARMIALKKLYYPSGGGRDILPGEEFDTLSDRDADALSKVKRAKRVDDQSKYQTRVMDSEESRPRAQPVPVVNVPADETPTKRVYKRRDMTAEGE